MGDNLPTVNLGLPPPTYAYGSTVNSGSAVSQTKSFGKTKASKIVSADGKGKVTFTENVTVQGNVDIPAGNLKLGSQTLTVTSAKLNKLLLNTNLTATTSEINTLDTVVATAAELNKMHGFTGTTEQMNRLDVTTAGQSEANKVLTTSENHGLVTFNKKVTAEDVLDAKVLELDSVAVTSTASELNVLDGITATKDELELVDFGPRMGYSADAVASLTTPSTAGLSEYDCSNPATNFWNV